MKKGSGFEKFFKSKEKTGAAKKEAIRKEKRDFRKDREEKIANAKREKRAQNRAGFDGPPKYNLEPPTNNRFQRQEGRPQGKPGFSPEKRNSRPGEGRPPADRRSFDGRQAERSDRKPAPFGNRDNKPKFQKSDRPERPRLSDQRQPERPDRKQTPYGNRTDKPKFQKSDRPERPRSSNDRQPERSDRKPTPFTNRDSKPRFQKSDRPEKPRSFDGPKPGSRNSSAKPSERKFSPSPAANSKFTSKRPADENHPKPTGQEGSKPRIPVSKAQPNASPTDLMPLNKYIAHSGICSRRDAVDLIKAGKVKVNGQLVVEPGQKVQLADDVTVAGRRLNPVKDFVYVLLNKPKDYITTTEDPQERRTVLDLLKGVPEEIRIYPVGRLDRNTSGVLLLTNDGDLSQKLTHPSNEIKKVYAVTLDKPLTRAHFDDILRGIELEDGPALVDSLAYTDTKDLTQVGVEIHSGRNRIVRRIFEHFGYDVKGLDRVMFAGLTKKNVNRGKWRYLNEREVRDLKFFRKGR